jgi:hypothetical protein
MYNYNTATWDDIGNLDTAGGETETTNIYAPTGNLADYVSSTNEVSVRVEYVTNNANNNDAWFAADYVYLLVDYTVIKNGAVSTVVGTIPFYTINANPQNESHQSCLGNMSAGDSCTISWSVNATGELGTTHEFYVLYNMTTNRNNVSDISTSHINITIANNAPPVVTYVNIAPSTPGLSEDLNCTFVVTDSLTDTLSATVYWYESGTLQYNQTINVTNGIEASAILDSDNTSSDDVWHCGVVPYDQNLYGTRVNSSTVNITASNPPTISNIQCQRFGAVWGSCGNIVFNDQFTAVRATCTDSDGYIVNASFVFSNQEDSHTYFSNNYTSVLGNVYTLDFSDITIEDSGNFDVIVTCIDNTSVSTIDSVSWFIPWGVLSSTLISPNTSINVSQNSFFNFTSKVTCTGGECGNINATLDPTPSWWNGHYLYRMRLNITNNQASVLQAGYSANVSINTSSSKFLSNGNDFRIVWLNGSTWQELDRINETTSFNSDNTVVWFKLQQSIASSSTDDTYYVYYGYSGASAAPANRSKVYLYFDDFNRADNSDITTEAAYHKTGGGTWSISGNKLVNVGAAGDPNKLEIDALGVVSYDVDMWTKINIYSTLGSSSDLWRMGLSSNMDDVGGDGQGYCLLLHQDHSSLDMLNDLRSWGTNGVYSWDVSTWYNMRFRVINPSSNTGYGKVWNVGTSEPATWTIDAGNFGAGAVRGYGNVGFGGSRQGDTTWFDDIIIRYIVTNEPTIEVLSEEEYGLAKGVIPMNSGDPFYTITNNPMSYTTTTCLGNMSSGDSCYTTWRVNATGTINSTWEFFVDYTADYAGVSNKTSNKINLIIIQNTAPQVSSILLNPITPTYTDNLYCNFTIIDSSSLDYLTVNLTWYRNGVYNSSSVQSVSANAMSSNILGYGNTTAGEIWKCGVQPYDQIVYGTQVNSSNVTILLNSPPVITNIQCLESGLWTDCSNLQFNDILHGVRANCTSSSLTISNVTFNFSNTPDLKTYFNTTDYSVSSDYWSYVQNVTLNNSGEFRVDVICTDNNSNSASSYVSWNLAWGTINISLVNPVIDTFVEQNQFFNFSAQIECMGGECGQVAVTLDPLSGSSPVTGVADSGFVYDNPGNDEEGGSYIQTQTYNGPQTGVPGTTWYYIVGEGDTTNTALSYINLIYNLTSLDMVPEDITNMTFGLIYCHSGENDVNQDFCDNDAPMEKTADGAQNVEVYDFTNDVWVDIGDITVHGDEAMYNESYSATGTFANYVNASTNTVLVRYEADFSDTGGDGFLAIDYATLTVSYTKLKRGAVSTIPGTIPFYTINPNPQNYTNTSCLYNMIAGGEVCQFSWLVNATGELNSTHDFFILYNMFTNQAYVSDGESRHVNITIRDSSLIPPVVTLEYPANNYYTNNASVNFNCSATDTEGLQNISLYGNFSGVFAFSNSTSLSGSSGSANFTRTLSEGNYLWNCIAYDTDSNFDWGNSNRTLTVDLTGPLINLSNPLEGESFTSADISFNITAFDNFDSVLNCSLMIDSVVESVFTADNNQSTIVPKTVSEGIHYWNVTCFDDAGNYNASETRNFTISDISPSVVLITANNIYQQNPIITLQYLPSDNNGITFANLIINGSVFATNDTVAIDILNYFTVTLSEGYYNWTVNVSDISNLTAQATVRYFTIDNTSPKINLTAPIDNASTNESNIAFNFTVTDNVDSSLVCDLIIDSVVEDNDFAATNGLPISRTINDIADGIYYWNITCIDDTGNNGTSSTYMLNISNPPTIILNDPLDNYSYNYNNPTLNYTPTDNLNLSNCTLILDNQINATETSINNSVQNSFSVEGLNEGYHNWTVSCFDISGLSSNIPASRSFLVDLQVPIITLFEPLNITYNGTSILFNYTVIDNYDITLNCSLMLDGSINISGIVSQNGTPVNFTNTIVDEGNHYWNITCFDDAGNYNTSNTWNFTNLVPPTVSLTNPASGSLLNYSQNIELVYQPYDAQGLFNTTLYLNGVFNVSDGSPSSGAFNSFFVNFSNDGFYYWQVNATDTLYLIGSSQVWNITIDTSPPVIGIMGPIQGQVVDWNNVNFTFNVTDNLDSVLVCNMSVDGNLELVNVIVPNGGINISYKLLYDGNHNWSVTCVDDIGWKTSVLVNFSVLAPPIMTLNFPTPEYWTTLRNITFNYTPQDAIGITNCSLYINGVFNQSDPIIEHNQYNYFNVTNMPDGKYNWTVLCIDETPDFNANSAPTQNFTIDNQGPVIILNYPPEGLAVNDNDVIFNWTATDYADSTIFCNLTIDGTINQTNISNISGIDFLQLVIGLSDGPHDWLVACIDDLGNPSTSATGNFTINQPDLYVNTSKITFNNTNPDENDTINITVNVSNIGGVPATNAFVEFWDGTPGVGVYIGNYTATVGTNSSAIFSTLWNITEGYHTIYVLADPYNIIGELNETNNNATKNISLLKSIINTPANASLFANSNISINFTLQDFTTGLINYSVYVDNVKNGQNGSVTDNISAIVYVNVTQGTHGIIIEALDALGRRKNSTIVYVIVDYTPPTPTINTPNATWFNYSSPTINISATDNRVTSINYTLYVDGSPDISGVISNNTPTLVNLTSLINGSYQIMLKVWDDLNNTQNSTIKMIYVDTVVPSILLNSPYDGQNFSVRTVVLNYTALDNLAPTTICSINLDGVIVDTYNNTNNVSRTYTANNLIEGTHYWNVTCTDIAGNANISETHSFNVYIGPSISLLTPNNNTWSNSPDNIFYFNVSDEVGLENCSLIFNSVINQTLTNVQITNNAINNFTIIGMTSGTYLWQVECYDNTTYHAYNITEDRTFYVDTINPEPYIMTENNSWFNIGNPKILVNITDNMDTVINYSIYVNGSVNASGTANNATSLNATLNALTNGTYVIILEALDEAGNINNSTSIIITVDSVDPSIILTYPDEGANVTGTSTNLNFTVNDNLASYLLCNLTLDGSTLASNINLTNGVSTNVTATSLDGGLHYWNVTCIDNAGNYNTSLTRGFFVVVPDLYINASKIYFNNSNPVENETINVTAEIENIGDNDATSNFTVEIRLNSLTGTLLGTFSMNLSVNESKNVSVNYTMPLGEVTFYVLVDTPLATNGTVLEKNETNNYASRTLTVSSWQFVLGYQDAQLRIANTLYRTLFEWNVTNETGSHVFAADVDSNINWLNLTAISRNRTNAYVIGDFNDIDKALKIENNSDSINSTYTNNNNPKVLKNISVFNHLILNVPYYNSTNNSNFETGILWDSGDGGLEFNASQDVIFIADVNKGAIGYNNTYDFEMRIPATLREYRAGSNAVALYTELE